MLFSSSESIISPCELRITICLKANLLNNFDCLLLTLIAQLPPNFDFNLRT